MERRALVTLDLDFANIRAYPPPSYAGIIVLRAVSQAKQDVVPQIALLLPLLADEPLDGCLWIVEEDRVRVWGKAE